MRSTKTAEAGFTLVELVVVVAIVAIVTLGTIAAVASVGRSGEPQRNRNLALMIVRNALERARTAAAYLPVASTPASSATVAGYAQRGDASYVLQTGTTAFTAQVAIPTVTCGTGSVARIPIVVTTVITPPASGVNGTSIAITASYPLAACAPATTATVTLQETLPPPSLAPGSNVYAPLAGEPAEQ